MALCQPDMTLLGQQINVNFALITRLERTADKVFPAPVPDQFPIFFL